MPGTPQFLLRVFIFPDMPVKLALTERPTSVDKLTEILKEKYSPRLDFDFTLHYEDADLDGQLCCLMNIEDLPERGTLQVRRSESGDTSSCASSDTDILPHVPLSQRLKTWPDVFVVPTFSFEVEHVLKQGNAEYEKTGKKLHLSKSQKGNILECMASVIAGYKPYPTEKEVSHAAEALLTTHPCLRETQSPRKRGTISPRKKAGSWKWSILYKMGSYRSKLAKAGCLEVSVNTGRKSQNNPGSPPPHSNVKKAKRAEVNFLPNFPEGEDTTSMENARLQILQEVEKVEKDLVIIEKLMQNTFSLRRLQIVQDTPMIGDFLDKWPALRLPSQICAEFHRITNINLRSQFFAQLDRHVPQLINLFRQKAARTGKTSEMLRDMIQNFDMHADQHIDMKRTLVLHGLPVYLRENDKDFFKYCNVESAMHPELSNTPVAILTVANEDCIEFPVEPVSAAVVIEDQIIVRDIPTWPDAFVLLFGLLYVLNIQYPRKLVHTFTFTQKMLFGLDDGKALKPCLQHLKNDLSLVL